jgi:Ribonuclease G/E
MLRKTKPKPNAELRIRISRQAVHEHIVDFCGTCQGRGEIPDQEGLEGAQRMKPCPECGGHGKRRYSDSERVELIGAPLRDVNRWMADAIALISEAESEAVRSASKLLGRW